MGWWYKAAVGMKTTIRGNCYVTSEALYHLLGGKAAGWKPMSMSTHDPHGIFGDDVHWFLKHESGLILDATAQQFSEPPDYSKARGRGFLTKEPSKRARKMMEAMLWQEDVSREHRS
jgi:hypothetical protein